MSTSVDTRATRTTPALPLTLPSGAEIKNRLVKAAMSEQLGGPANEPTPELARVYRRWAQGGVGLLITGNVMIDHRDERATSIRQPRSRPGRIAGVRRTMRCAFDGAADPRRPVPLTPACSAAPPGLEA